MAQRDPNGPGEVYVVQVREFVLQRLPVYKVGRSFDAVERLKHYPKGSKLWCHLPVGRMKDCEDAILAQCRSAFQARTDLGAEYFEAPLQDIVQVLTDCRRRTALR